MVIWSIRASNTSFINILSLRNTTIGQRFNVNHNHNHFNHNPFVVFNGMYCLSQRRLYSFQMPFVKEYIFQNGQQQFKNWKIASNVTLNHLFLGGQCKWSFTMLLFYFLLLWMFNLYMFLHEAYNMGLIVCN